jgi:hypothetical protein
VLVPTLDVDLIWHTHMLSPLDYRDDCQAILGRVLSHDAQMEARYAQPEALKPVRASSSGRGASQRAAAAASPLAVLT